MRTPPEVDTTVRVGSVELANPVMCASGTAGHGTELSPYLDLASLGAFVVKSLSAEPWAGNAAPRLVPTPAGMINSVGLQGPGVEAWIAGGCEDLRRQGVRRIVVSIWGRGIDEYRRAAAMLADAPDEVVAVEVNLSCPNLDGGRHLFAHDPTLAAEVIECAAACRRPLWAKLSPNTDRLASVAAAVSEAGAEAVTLVNTYMGLRLDLESRRPVLGGGGGGVSGPAIHPLAVRAVYDCRAAHPDLPIIGVGGVQSAVDAVELMMAGAQAIQVGTAHFVDPAASAKVLTGLVDWCGDHDVGRVSELTGAAHE